jgi:hypothetical protein
MGPQCLLEDRTRRARYRYPSHQPRKPLRMHPHDPRLLLSLPSMSLQIAKRHLRASSLTDKKFRRWYYPTRLRFPEKPNG